MKYRNTYMHMEAYVHGRFIFVHSEHVYIITVLVRNKFRKCLSEKRRNYGQKMKV